MEHLFDRIRSLCFLTALANGSLEAISSSKVETHREDEWVQQWAADRECIYLNCWRFCPRDSRMMSQENLCVNSKHLRSSNFKRWTEVPHKFGYQKDSFEEGWLFTKGKNSWFSPRGESTTCNVKIPFGIKNLSRTTQVARRSINDPSLVQKPPGDLSSFLWRFSIYFRGSGNKNRISAIALSLSKSIKNRQLFDPKFAEPDWRSRCKS